MIGWWERIWCRADTWRRLQIVAASFQLAGMPIGKLKTCRHVHTRLFASKPIQGFARVRGEGVRVVGGDVLVKLLGPGPVAELLVGLAELVHRVGAALGALAEGGEAFDRRVGTAQLVEVDFAQQPA